MGIKKKLQANQTLKGLKGFKGLPSNAVTKNQEWKTKWKNKVT